jgi:hypothetical protein
MAMMQVWDNICIAADYPQTKITNPAYDGVASSDDHGIRDIYKYIDGKPYHGYMDEEGRIIIAPSPSNGLLGYSNGFILIYEGEPPADGGDEWWYESARYKALNEKGETVRTFDTRIIQYDGENGIAARLVEGKNRYALTDASGKPITSFDYESLRLYSIDSAVWGQGQGSRYGNYGWLSRDGSVKLPFEYWRLYSANDRSTSSDFSYKEFQTTEGTGIAKDDGTIIIPAIYSVGQFSEGFIHASKQGKSAVFDKKGINLPGFIYEHVGDFNEGFAAVRVDGKWGYIDSNMQLAIPAIYHYGDKKSHERKETEGRGYLLGRVLI